MTDALPLALPPVPTAVLLSERGILRLSGADTGGFLQNLLTNDMTALARGQAVYAALLSPQGRYLHDLIAAPGADGTVLLDVEAARRDDLLARLERFRLRAKVVFEDVTGAWECTAVIGDGAHALAGIPPTPGAAAPFAGGVAVADPRTAALGVRVLAPAGNAAAALTAAAAGSFDQWERLRLELAVPDGARDLIPDRSLPMESGFDTLNALSWTKGCYVGQEVTARMRYRGTARRGLVAMRTDGPPPPPGAAVLCGGADAGEVRSAGFGLALVSLRTEFQEDAAAPLTAGQTTLTPLHPGRQPG